MRIAGRLRWIVLGLSALAVSGASAFADIKSFNDAMLAKDYKKAAVEAASTWSTLEKTRPDIAVIAREFALAAYLSGDFATAITYAETASTAGVTLNESRADRISSELLLRLAEHQKSPSMPTRDKLYAALEASATLPGIDLVSYLGANALVSFDADNEYWKSARASAALAEKLTAQGGPGYAAPSLQFGLIKASAQFSLERDVESYDALVNLQARVVAEINRSSADKVTTSLAPIYWNTVAWKSAASTFLGGSSKFKEYEANAKPAPSIDRNAPGGLAIAPPLPVGACVAVLASNASDVNFPMHASMKDMYGTVILLLDIDASGRVTDAKMLGAAPALYFGKAALDGAKRFRFAAAKDSAPGCSLAQSGKVFTFVFRIRGR